VIGDGGLVVREGDSRALSAATKRMMDTSDETAAMRALGLGQVAGRFTWEQVARRMAAVYGQLAGGIRGAT